MDEEEKNKATPKPCEEKREEEQPSKPPLAASLEELDALIEKRLARERKKLARQAGAPLVPTAAPGDQLSPAAQPAADTAAQDAFARELLIARAQVDAYKEGVAPGAVEDAVYLAVMQAEKAGEADEEGVRDALKEVLKRHPEWKPQKKDAAKGGFKVGVDTTGADEKVGAKQRALPLGKVIF